MTDDDVEKTLKAIVKEISRAAFDCRRRARAGQAHRERSSAKQFNMRAADIRQLQQQAEQRAAERKAQRELSLRMIDLGYKALAKELHPDKGGSTEVMARLNRARAHTKQMS